MVATSVKHDSPFTKPFLIASMWCVSDLKNDFVVVVVFLLLVVLGAKLLSKFPLNWKIVLRLENIMQYALFIPD